MSRRTIEIISSDLSGDEGAKTVVIPGLTLDLTDAEKGELLAFLAPYRQAERAAAKLGPRTTATPPGQKVTDARTYSRQMRQWLNAHGYVVAVNGRIPADLMRAFETRTPNPDAAKDQIRDLVAAANAPEGRSVAAAEPPQKPARARKATTPKAEEPQGIVLPLKRTRAAKAVPAKTTPAKTVKATAAATKTTGRKATSAKVTSTA